MNAKTPRLIDNELHYEVPNVVMQNQLERTKSKLLKYIRERVNNYKLELVIDVNEAETKRYAYTPHEKYEKLKEKNKAIALLKKTLYLEL